MAFGQYEDLKPRLGSLGLVVLLHVIVIWALVVGLRHRSAAAVILPPIQTTLIEEVVLQTDEPPPPPPPPIDLPPASFVPPPEILVQPPPPQQAITSVRPDALPEPPPIYAPHRIAPLVNANRNCPEPVYPSIALRLGEHGAVTLLFLIDVDGRVVESRIEESSGYSRLDEAARRALSRCRFTPGTVDGVPERAWAPIRYIWQIE